MKPLSIALVALLAAPGCEPQYAYVPVTNATVIAGHVAADYPIPKEAPRGDVRLASYGIADLGSTRDKDDHVRALHLRVTLIDNGDRAWTMDTREQLVDLDGYGQSIAAYASANAGSAPPSITVSPMGKRVVDLFFPLPQELQRAERLPTFDVVWKVHADKDISERTPFERISVEPPAAYDPIYDYGADYYWGPPYYYDPLYGNRGYYRGAARFGGHPVYIHRSTTPGTFAPHAGGHR
jgi:hypothetical protein